ncbi:MAG: LPS export ABC transporter periplasmic protein LptC [Bacteroidales bacterium]|jgi:LPS export ABC transporter protein LptC|nr:LPS export ABC transporter periplasmic protein LptC [Bacteroidales bacterium]
MKTYLLILISVFSFLCFFSCENKTKNKISQKKDNSPSQIIKQAHIFRSQNGEVEVEIKSPLIQSYEGDSARMIFPKGVKVKFFNEDMTIKSTLVANYAINYNNSNKVYLRDSIVIINYNNEDTIYCQDLIWDRDLKIVSSEKKVQRNSASGIAYGDGFISSENMDSVRIKNHRGIQVVKEDD